MNNFSIGCDIEEISRFEGKTLENDAKFLAKIFTQNELNYSFQSKNYASHLCARFCAKEAIVKALSEFDITDVYYSDIEIQNKKSGAPCAKIAKYPDIEIKISLSHSKTNAMASVILIK
ncbi:holo-ACP synthase [bacterium]|nr:holo-ACP synthase [bacterium]